MNNEFNPNETSKNAKLRQILVSLRDDIELSEKDENLLYKEVMKVTKYLAEHRFCIKDYEDYGHDVYMEILRSIKTYDPEIAGFNVWVRLKARNVANDQYKKAQRRAEICQVIGDTMVETEDDWTSYIYNMASGGNIIGSEDAYLVKEAYEQIVDAINSLKSNYRDALYLMLIKGCTKEEAMKETGRSSKLFDNDFSRGRKALREKLEDKYDDIENGFSVLDKYFNGL